MIKNYLLLLTLFFFSSIKAQLINIPDVNFKSALINADPEISNYVTLDINGYWSKVDLNEDGEIQRSEALLISTLYLGKKDISSLDGIQEFKNLKLLECMENKIASLDLRDLVNLEILYCDFNELTNLNVENLSNLQDISCTNNQLVSLDLHTLINVKSFISNGNNLTNLNISGLSRIAYLDYSYNSLPNLDISFLRNLKHLGCVANEISTLNLENLENLELLFCSYNQLSDLNLSNLPKLRFLTCFDNLFTNLDVTKLFALETFSFGSNTLTSIDLKNLKNLSHVGIVGSSLSSIDFSESHFLTNIFVSSNPLLESIFMKNGSLETGVIIDSNENLKYVCADENQITQIENLLKESGKSNFTVNSYCSFVPEGESFTIQGKTIVDSDKNGCDTNDIPASFLKFEISDGVKNGRLITNETGKYAITVPTGFYIITPVFENPDYFSVSPASLQVEFPTLASPLLQDFCITPVDSHKDLEVSLLPITVARPGFTANYKIIFKNKGNVAQSGNVNLLFKDSVLDLINATPVVSSQTSNNLSWSFTNLKPFETREIEISFKVNSPIESPAVLNGDILNYTATITSLQTDEKPLDNTFALNQIVVGSYDPNDKTCLEGDVITPALIGEYVHYMIRFENTGSYAAENIVVKDMIDLSKFDIATLTPTSASHSYSTKISDGNKVEFIFENINLPFNDANNDGYIAFKIKTLPTLVVGDSFTNEANIYFDYNLPVLTNTAKSTFNALSTQDFEFSNYIQIYPNPSMDILNVTSNNLEIKSIEIYDMLGQLVIAVPNAEKISKVNTSNLRTGNYIFKIKTNKGVSATKFVKI